MLGVKGASKRQRLSEISCPTCKQDQLGVNILSGIEDMQGATLRSMTTEAVLQVRSVQQQIQINRQIKANQYETPITDLQPTNRRVPPWISPAPISVKMRLFCIPYAGGVSENVFAR